MRYPRSLLSLALVINITPTLQAQTVVQPSDNILTVFRESVKVGKGARHDAHEDAWARAIGAVKGGDPFVAMSAVTGPNEVWYMQTFANWEAYQKSSDYSRDNAAMAAVDRKFRPAEEEFLSDSRLMTLRLRPEMSYGGSFDLPKMKFVSVTRVLVRPGHAVEYAEARRLINEAHLKAGVDEKWSMYEVTSGAPNGTYYIFVSRPSLGDMDQGDTMHGPAYIAALGAEEGQKKIAGLIASSVVSQQTDHFAFAPSQSKPPAEWVAANPGFWKPKPVAAPARKPSAPKP
jgi:hypothetical protein